MFSKPARTIPEPGTYQNDGDEGVQELILEFPQPAVALLKLNRPEARNALGQPLRAALAARFAELAGNDEVRVIVLTGNEKVFAAGADLRAMADAGPVDIMLLNNQRMWQAIAGCPKPVIAAVNGYALGGGCELAMHADIIVAGEGAMFGQPEIKVGIMPGAGGIQRLARTVGKFKAFRMLLTGEPIGARDAEAAGLVSEVVPDAEVLDRALALAGSIATMPPLAVAQIKEVLLGGQDASLDTALLLERKAFQLLFASADQKEGMHAFLDKRQPNFRGR
ncbi:MAG: enoyl-CoA hydratase/isomerase family protein [Rhodocyclaceae bacterium]|nr:enoyl-CoA hydratase/isomerase family protein [Rhodocyclaceae bacterium]